MSRSTQSADNESTGCCSYCGLPVETDQPSDSTVRLYCCYGCRIAESILGSSDRGDVEGSESDAAWQLTRLGLAIFFSMNVMVLALAQWSWDLYPDTALESPRAQSLLALLRAASMLLALVVFLLLAVSMAHNALQQLMRRRLTTDLLVILGVGGALAYSVLSVFHDGQHTYFEVSCMVLVAMTLGRWLEATGKLKTTSSLRSLQQLLPTEVRRVQADQRVADVLEAVSELDSEETGVKAETGVVTEMIPLVDVFVGDCLRVLPGERLPVDGIIVHGRAAIDEMIMTGESRPVTREKGDAVYAGARNEDGDLLIQVTAPPHGGALRRIVDAVVQAALRKSKIQGLADRVAAWMTPLIVALALLAFAWHSWASGAATGLMVSLSVLLIACPCALGVATPLAVWAAMGRASEAGVLFRSGDAIQQLSRANHFCFDKTGTLTTGAAVVDGWVLELPDATLVIDPHQDVAQQLTLAGEDATFAARAAYSAASASNHLLARAVVRLLDELGESPLPMCLEETVAGDGVRLRSESLGEVRLGRLEWLREASLATARGPSQAEQDRWQVPESIQRQTERARATGRPTVAIGWQGAVRGLFVLTEELRLDASSSLAALRQFAGASVLTGDVSRRAEMLAAEVSEETGKTGDTAPMEVRAGLHPEQKQEAIAELQRERGRIVAMVGDGINDAPALAAADVGIAMGCGADVARDTADVCLLGDSLTRLVWASALARQCMTIVKQNLTWAFTYNGIGIAAAVCGQLNPIGAALAMVGSSLLVIGNSLRLSSFPLTTEGAAVR